MIRTPWDDDTEFRIKVSETPHTEDGYWPGEPKTLSCPHCSAAVQLTTDPADPGVDDLPHDSGCPQRFVRSQWFRQQLE